MTRRVAAAMSSSAGSAASGESGSRVGRVLTRGPPMPVSTTSADKTATSEPPPDRDREIGGAQCGGVVDAVADEGDRAVLGERAHDASPSRAASTSAHTSSMPSSRATASQVACASPLTIAVRTPRARSADGRGRRFGAHAVRETDAAE